MTVAEQREEARRLLLLGISALSRALNDNERITDDALGLRALRGGAESVTDIVVEMVREAIYEAKVSDEAEEFRRG